MAAKDRKELVEQVVKKDEATEASDGTKTIKKNTRRKYATDAERNLARCEYTTRMHAEGRLKGFPKSMKANKAKEASKGTANVTALKADKFPEAPLKDSVVADRSASNSASAGILNGEVVINGMQYCVLSTLGIGGSRKVFEVLDADKKLYALKLIDLSGAEANVKKVYLKEVELLRSLHSCKSVITLIDYELREDVFYVLLEKGDIDMASFLKMQRDEIDGPFIFYYWRELLKCVRAIHERGIIHMDIKPANFLFVQGKLKLIDFGLSAALAHFAPAIMMDGGCGTLAFMAPEALTAYNDSGIKITKKADVWSLGCMLYEMVYGRPLFEDAGRSITSTIYKITIEEISFPDILDKDLLDVVKRCLKKDPKLRPSVEELLSHPYFKGKEHVVPVQSRLMGAAHYRRMV